MVEQHLFIIWANARHKEKEILNRPNKIVIGDHVWLGLDVCVLKDSIIPPNSIVGAKSVFTKNSNKSFLIILL